MTVRLVEDDLLYKSYIVVEDRREVCVALRHTDLSNSLAGGTIPNNGGWYPQQPSKTKGH